VYHLTIGNIGKRTRLLFILSIYIY